MSFEDFTWLLALFAIWIIAAFLPVLWSFSDHLSDKISKK